MNTALQIPDAVEPEGYVVGNALCPVCDGAVHYYPATGQVLCIPCSAAGTPRLVYFPTRMERKPAAI